MVSWCEDCGDYRFFSRIIDNVFCCDRCTATMLMPQEAFERRTESIRRMEERMEALSKSLNDMSRAWDDAAQAVMKAWIPFWKVASKYLGDANEG